MSKNLDSERSVTANKMYPMDLAPQKITIVKSVTNSDVKMAHLIPGQPKTSGTGQIITHTGPVGLMRPAAQILSPGVTSQPQMIVSGTVPILQGTQIVSQGSQLLGQTSQLISQSQLIGSGGQILSPGTQIISQGSQLSAQVSSSSSSGVNSVQVSVPSSITGSQVLNVGGLVSGAGNLVVSSSVRTLPPSVRVLPPLPHHNTRPASLSTVNVSSPSVLVSKSVSHVPRGLAAGASLAVRPVQSTMQSSQAQGPAHYNESAWSGRGARGSLVFGARAAARPAPRAARAPAPPAAAPPLSAVQTIQTPMQHASIVTLPTTVLTTTGVISSSIRPAAAAPRPLPLLQRNYQQTKVVGVNPAARSTTPVGNSAPAQLYYEVPRAAPTAPPPATPPATPPAAPPAAASHAAQLLLPTAHALASLAPVCSAPPASHAAQLLLPTAHALASLAPGAVSNQSANSGPMSEMRQTAAPVSLTQPRPTILRKRDSDGSPTKSVGVETSYSRPGWEGVPWGQLTDHEDVNNANSGGSTTMSASSSPTREPSPADTDASPRKKPRKQMLSNEVRQCDYQPDESPPSPPPVNIIPPKRPQLSASYQCGWRATALHFTRPADVRRRAPRPADILQIAARRHVLASADGWRVHHLTAQMDALVSLEADVGEQLKSVLRALETASGRALSALQPHSHALLELLKGNIQRSTIVCEGIQEARGDILRVFKHRNFVSDILTRQADKRCFRKHRSQS